MTATIEAVGVVIPVHDEEERLGDCLESVLLAVSAVRLALRSASVWVVLDACTDDSARIAARYPVGVHAIDAACVGRARAAGVDVAVAGHADVPVTRLWTAHTDADSVVPPHWLVHQLELAAGGADVVVGTVRPDFRELSTRQVEAWWVTHTPGIANGHVHGANLGMRASTLIGAGGFEDVCEHEDVWLVDEARDLGARVVASDAAWVRTSGRQVGRTSGGYARYLREDLIPAAEARASARSVVSDRA